MLLASAVCYVPLCLSVSSVALVNWVETVYNVLSNFQLKGLMKAIPSHNRKQTQCVHL